MIKQEESRVAIVTGGAGGLGFPIAQRLAEQGHRVAIWDLSLERAEAAAAQLENAKGYMVDVTNQDTVYAVTAQVVKDMGHLGILVTCAGHNVQLEAFVDYPLDGWFCNVAESRCGFSLLSGRSKRNVENRLWPHRQSCFDCG